MNIASCFPAYEGFGPLTPVWCITPEIDGCFHRFFDTSPVSPSGRYVALTRLRDEARAPGPGDVAEVVVVDLESGETKTVAETRGFDGQLGAQAQWGPTDHDLYFNDMDVETWRPYAVRLDVLTGERTELDGTVYMVSPDGTKLAAPCLKRTALTQAGYGVVVPQAVLPLNDPADEDDGLYITDTATGEVRLLVSFAQMCDQIEALRDEVKGRRGAFYGFHVKWNRQGTRLMFVIRHRAAQDGRRLAHVVTMKSDGSDPHLALPGSRWSRGGHHPDWCPDGDHISQNLIMDDGKMRFVQYRYDGSDLRTIVPDVIGSGHPTLHPNGKHIVTDAYLSEPLAFGDGTTPIRWIDVEGGAEQTLVRIRTKPLTSGPLNVLRVDPHPAWDRAYRRIVFNACPEGRRRVFLADLGGLLD